MSHKIPHEAITGDRRWKTCQLAGEESSLIHHQVHVWRLSRKDGGISTPPEEGVEWEEEIGKILLNRRYSKDQNMKKL